MAGLGTALAVYVAAAATGLLGEQMLAIVTIFGQSLSPFVAGYVAGRLSGPDAVFNGGLSGLTVFGIAAVLSVAGGAALGALTLGIIGVVSIVVGTAGAVLALQASRN